MPFDFAPLDIVPFALPRDLRCSDSDEVSSATGGDTGGNIAGNDAPRSLGMLDVRASFRRPVPFEKPCKVPVLSARGGVDEGRAPSASAGAKTRDEASAVALAPTV